MRNWRIRVLQGFQITNCSRAVFLTLLLLTIFGSAEIATAQGGFPGPSQRERNRAMDEHDRAINRMKNDAKAVNERRRNLFPQINEDFQRIQIIHNEMVRMLQSDKGFDYNRLADLSDDLKKRTARLRTNLALSEPEKTEAQPTHTDAIDDSHMKKNIVELHDLVVSFVASPIFKNLGVVDSKVIDAAQQNLDDLIHISEEIKKEAKILGKKK